MSESTLDTGLTLECWECTARLRWNLGRLEQLWFEKFSGKMDWRPVPTAEECEIK